MAKLIDPYDLAMNHLSSALNDDAQAWKEISEEDARYSSVRTRRDAILTASYLQTLNYTALRIENNLKTIIKLLLLLVALFLFILIKDLHRF